MLIPTVDEAIENRDLDNQLTKVLTMMADVLRTSTIVERIQMERDRKPGRQYYSAVTLFLLYVSKEIFQCKYDGVRARLQPEHCEAIGLPKKEDGSWRKPRGSTICEFKTDVISTTADELMAEISEAIIKRCTVVKRGRGYVVVTLDSTPAQASRYNFDAEYNGHYKIRMDKLHIIMIDGHPLFMIPTDGNTGDNEPVKELFERFDGVMSKTDLDRNDLKIMADGGYDSFMTFSIIHRLTGRILNCHIREGSVLHKEASWPELQKRYSRMHKMSGYDPHKKNDELYVINFLSKHGKHELVGKYIRDKELIRMQKQEEAGIKDTDRAVCEVVHHSMKSWIDFTTVKIRHRTRHVTLKCKFLVAQLISVVFKGYVEMDLGRE